MSAGDWIESSNWIESSKGIKVMLDLDQDQQQCLEMLVWATQQLQVECDLTELLKMAKLIVQAMTGPWRSFHSPEHIFNVGGSGDPIEVLAALFHDIIYVQVDRSISFSLCTYVAPFIWEVNGHLVIRERSDIPESIIFELVTALFEFAPGQTLSPFAGQNEFLSAIVAAKALQPFLPLAMLAQIVTCIEATIPFRPIATSGVTVTENLHQHLRQANNHFHLGLTEQEIGQTLRRAVRVTNRDVENFADPSPARFLDNTWSLLPETNHNLMNANSYTVRHYRTALEKMEAFMSVLQPELVFRQFQNEPSDRTYQELVSRAARNIEVARLYLAAKLVSITILESLSSYIGRDIPLSTLIGGLPSSEILEARWEHCFPEIASPYQPMSDLEIDVLELLERGRSRDSDYDTKNSPLATFIVKSVGFTEVKFLLGAAKEFFAGRIKAGDFLANCDSKVVQAATNGVIQLFENRQAALRLVSLSLRRFEKKTLIHGTQPNNHLIAQDEGSVLLGGDGHDTLIGGAGDDVLYGGAGNDRLYGGPGNNILIGGKGDDYLCGGKGDDLYVYAPGDGVDIIEDEGGTDVLKLVQILSHEVELKPHEADQLWVFYKGDLIVKMRGVEYVETEDGRFPVEHWLE